MELLSTCWLSVSTSPHQHYHLSPSPLSLVHLMVLSNWVWAQVWGLKSGTAGNTANFSCCLVLHFLLPQPQLLNTSFSLASLILLVLWLPQIALKLTVEFRIKNNFQHSNSNSSKWKIAQISDALPFGCIFRFKVVHIGNGWAATWALLKMVRAQPMGLRPI